MNDKLSAELQSLRIDRDAPPPPRAWPKALLAVGLLGGAGAAVAAALPYLEAQVFKTEVSLTQIALVSPAQASVQVTATGYVQADRTSKVAPKVPGRVLELHVAQGDEVTEGQVLLELDPADDKASIAAAQSRVAAAAAQAKGAGARAETAKAELAEVQQRVAREQKLASEGITATSVVADLQARAAARAQNVKAAEAAEAAARAEAGALGAQVNVLKTGLNNLVLVAPISGRVINKPPQLGEFVGPQPAGLSVDMGGIEIADFTTLLVEADVPETRLHLIKPGAPAEIVLDAFPTTRYRGKVKEITPQVDRAKATIKVKVSFVDATEGVLPDMAARVSFLAKELDEQAIKAAPKTVVPGSAVTERAGAKVVFVVDGDRVRMAPIELGPAFGSGFELQRGPSPGAQVVANPPPTLADGQRVKEAAEE